MLRRLAALLNEPVMGFLALVAMTAGVASLLHLLREMAEEADYLHETVDDIREAVLSIIDLHIDVAGHDMNRFMRLLAIVSVLGLIPTIAGGLLGMNLADSPWAVTLGEVSFATLVLMLGVL